MRSAVTIAVITALASVASPLARGDAAAQGRSELRPGARIQVWSSKVRRQHVVGTLVTLDSVSLVVAAPARRFNVSIASIDSVHVSRRRSHSRAGALIGSLAGGGLIGSAAARRDCAPPAPCNLATALATFAGSMAGALAGAFIGSLIEHDKWERRRISGQAAERPPQQRRPVSVANGS
jgi:hypothetical protein